MQQELINTSFEKFNALTVLIVGDVMIDAYMIGKAERISPEAPVPVIHVKEKENRLGGAANVALNIQALGAKPIICTVIGNDEAANTYKVLLQNKGMSTEGTLQSSSRKTTVKTRVIAQNQQIVRVDEEEISDINHEDEIKFIAHVSSIIKNHQPDVLIFEDYNKGVLTERVITAIITECNQNNIPVCVDPKKKNFLAYKNVTLFKPNLKELKEGLKCEPEQITLNEINTLHNKLKSLINHKISLITLSEKGIYINSKHTNEIYPAHLRNIADVSGAGDTVISVAALCIATDTPHAFMAQLANIAGGLVCEKVGVVPIDKQQLFDEAIRLIK